MQDAQIVTKADFSRRLGVTRGRVSQYVRMGLPVRRDGRLDLQHALAWIRANIMPPSRPAGGVDVQMSQQDLERLLDG